MRTILYGLLLFLPLCVNAQYEPAEGARLHYRLVNFKFDKLPVADKYTVEIAKGHITDIDSFRKTISIKKDFPGVQCIVELPDWGAEYSWRITSESNNVKVQKHSAIFHFSTDYVSWVDTSLYRMRIVQNSMKYDSVFLFSDCGRGLYDMHGAALWYVPLIPGILDTTVPVRDLKITPQGTITFIANTQAYEIDYNGRLLWQAPDNGMVSGDTSEFYHHEFTRLANGNYMIAGGEYIKKRVPTDFAQKYQDNENIIQEDSGYYVNVFYGTLIEYAPDKRVVWYWKTDDYFKDAELFIPELFENYNLPAFHYNSFFLDEDKGVLYGSFRNINRIVKLSYPEKEPLADYGNAAASKSLFVGQHSCRIDKSGNLYLFNNNFSGGNRRAELSASSLLVLKEPEKYDERLSVLYSFSCALDNETGVNAKGGGSVYELEDGAMLVCMGTVNRAFIVKDNVVLWKAFTEYKNGGRWIGQSNYRISIVQGDKQIYKLLNR